MNHIAIFTALLSFLGLVTGGVQAAERPDSGVTGQVFIYTCPVVREGDDCLYPYQARITVRTPHSRIIKRFTTNAQGHFQVSLRPGRYVLVPASPNGRRGFPLAPQVEVTVTRGTYTTTTITFDSGLR